MKKIAARAHDPWGLPIVEDCLTPSVGFIGQASATQWKRGLWLYVACLHGISGSAERCIGGACLRLCCSSGYHCLVAPLLSLHGQQTVGTLSG